VFVELHLFAVARQLAGTGCLRVELESPATVGTLRLAVGEQMPALRPLLPGMMVAVDSEYAHDDRPIHQGSELALIPPVSGGSEQKPSGSARTASEPMFRIANLKIWPGVLEMIPEAVARAFQVLPLDYDGKSLRIAIARGDDVEQRVARFRKVLYINNPIRWARTDPGPLAQAINDAYRLAATELFNCPHSATGKCKTYWLCLEPSPEPHLRACENCKTIVHLCETEQEAKTLAGQGKRVALFQPAMFLEQVPLDQDEPTDDKA